MARGHKETIDMGIKEDMKFYRSQLSDLREVVMLILKTLRARVYVSKATGQRMLEVDLGNTVRTIVIQEDEDGKDLSIPS